MPHDFILIGGHPAVDLVNTRPVLDGRTTELLGEPRDLATWLGASGLVGPSEARSMARAWSTDVRSRSVLEGAIGYREDLRSALQTVADGGRPPARLIAATDRTLRQLPVRLELTGDTESGLELRTRAVLAEPRHALGVIARSVADLLVSPDLPRLRRCGNPECVLFFLDPTRNHTRRWCSMSTCGNRSKQREFQRRRRRV